jgi:hypothetical protein
MKTTSARLSVTFGLLWGVACGARSTMDPVPGYGPDDSLDTGGTSNGGYGGSGGASIGAGGYWTGTGGYWTGTGGTYIYTYTGGTIGTTLATGGYHGDGGAIGSGGRAGTGGTIVSTGGTYPLTGGTMTNTGGTRPGTGGAVGGAGGQVTGGTIGRGGSGGTGGGGGGIAAGGAIAYGGTTGSGGAIAYGGAIGRGGAIAYGGTMGSGGDGGAACSPLPANEELIDDLNDGDRFIPSLDGRAGAWFDSHDASPNSKMYPDPTTGFVPSATGDACRKYAAYVAGAGYVLWGADLWFGLGSPYDASKYTGISFWAKVDSGSVTGIRVAFPDQDTQPDGNQCTTNPSSGPSACYDHYGQRLTFTTTWTKYKVPFSALSQDGWGRAGVAFDPTTLYEVLFQIPVGASFSIWIDDVAFIL